MQTYHPKSVNDLRQIEKKAHCFSPGMNFIVQRKLFAIYIDDQYIL
jgi:hypothetical protein